MKLLLRQMALIALLGTASSCAFFNDRTVDISINSNPPGADIFIEGRNYGRTPATIRIEPNNYIVTLAKEGYGSTNFKTEVWWGTVRTDVNGKRTADGDRCLLDMVSLIFSFNSWNRAKCGDFKEKQYMITIPHLGSNYNSGNRGNSMMGIGADPSEMINYYYNQDMSANVPAAANPAQQPIQQQMQQPAQQTGQQQGNQNPYSQEYRGEQYRNNYPR